jgi:hypothetical protein
MLERAWIQCTEDQTLEAVYRLPGAELETTFTWVEGVNRVSDVVEVSWAALVEDKGFTVEVRLVDVEPGECSAPEQVVLASLYNAKGSRVQGIAVDPYEWPGGAFALAGAAHGGPVEKARAGWAAVGSWKWLALVAAVAGLAYAAWKGKWLE